MKSTPSSTTSERFEAIQRMVSLCFEKNIFRNGYIGIDENKLDTTIFEYFERLKVWKKRISNEPESMRLDRHKVGALTAICILDIEPLVILKPNEELNSFEVFPNVYLSMRLAIARVVQECPPHFQKELVYNSREIALLISGFNECSWKPRELALFLFEFEENIKNQIEKLREI
ncbi:hypothetical protein [Leptospira weilii]|uniref:hypothetical protein n=1 Tax=Leptospira weilii TaxID=28184 RepID=UPI00114706E9|nr:hypothetical protein [Leptospira weilii]